jgi:hypothetical protein
MTLEFRTVLCYPTDAHKLFGDSGEKRCLRPPANHRLNVMFLLRQSDSFPTVTIPVPFALFSPTEALPLSPLAYMPPFSPIDTPLRV